jgi:3-oxoacyl-[acyl-carrier protein] reductase
MAPATGAAAVAWARRDYDRPGRDVEVIMTAALDLVGRRALVTGAARGIGRAIALALGAGGADVAVNYRERAGDAEAVAQEARRLGRKTITVRADVSQSSEVATLIERVEAELGPVDILVNNAGVAIQRGLDDLSEADFDRTIAVNLKSAFLCTQAVVAGMRTRRWGRIVNISSGAARGAGVIGVHYNASKAGMEGLTRGYAARLVKEGITVNAVAPSLIATEMLASSADAVSKVPLGRLGLPEEVAQAVLMVIGNPYMSGQTVQVNGGMHFN